MDHRRDSDWIETLETTALSNDEEAETEHQTPLHAQNNISKSNLIIYSLFASVYADAPSRGGLGGVSYDSPPSFKDLNHRQALSTNVQKFRPRTLNIPDRLSGSASQEFHPAGG